LQPVRGSRGHCLGDPRQRMSACREREQGEEDDAFTKAAAMLLHGGTRWGDCNGKKEEVEKYNNGMTVAALGDGDR
jgi:hypothetical protein